MRNRKLWWLTGGVAALLLVTFGLLTPLVPQWWGDVEGWGASSGVVVAVGGAALLTADVVIPVPSSLVMVGLGAALGFPQGLIAGFVGLVGSALAGYGIGRLGLRRSRAWLGPDHATLSAAMARHGFALVILSRPIPVLAETVAILAGCAGANVWRFLLASAVGSAVTAVVYAAAGAGLMAGGSLGWVALAAAVSAASLAWLIARAMVNGVGSRAQRHRATRPPRPPGW